MLDERDLEYLADGGPEYRFELDRREFFGVVGAGLLITAAGTEASAQRRGESAPLGARLHISEDGIVTVFTGKVELGQGARTEITAAAAEELRLPVEGVRLVMSDTDLTPDDGLTVGSRTTPYTIPEIRKAAAAAREILVKASKDKPLTYADLARLEEPAKSLQGAVPADVKLTRTEDWKVMGTPVPKIGARDVVMGRNRYAADVIRPNMLYGKVLRPPSYKATLTSVDLEPARQMKGVIAVRDGNFVGCAAPTSFLAGNAVKAIAPTARWKETPQPSSNDIFSYFKAHPREDSRGRGAQEQGSVEEGLRLAKQKLAASYEIAYIQHAPMEPRSAVAEWENAKLTVWTATQGPFRVRDSLMEVFHLPPDKVRVIALDTGGGFGGKNSPESAIEAARLAKAAGRPVSLRFTRVEEFTWAYFRPGGVIDIKAGTDADGNIIAWDAVNYNSGRNALDPPYKIPNKRTLYQPCETPLRQAAYRALASTANNFAREAFLDELAEASGADPLEIRLRHADNDRLRAVLEGAAARFGWQARRRGPKPGVGVGIACGFEKMSYMAVCVEVEANRQAGTVTVREVCEAFECGAIQNPRNLEAQVQGCVIMGLGGALDEAIEFADGRILNPRFSRYDVPRYEDVPKIEVVLLNRPDLPSVGGGETPIIGVAPAIANAIHDAIGVRVRSMPIRPALAAMRG